MKHSLYALLVLGFATGTALSDSYYSKPALFSKRPDSGRSTHVVDRFGPVGISIELIQPAFTMRVHGIEEGSPAEGSGLRPGQIIESINGESLRDIDPRIQLGNMITAAEAADGVLNMRVAEEPGGPAEEVVVRIPALGGYSPTWPLDCEKSDRIVRDYAEYLKSPGADLGLADMGMLFLMSTGDPEDTAFVGEWARGLENVPTIPWHLGYGGLAICEYYLRTGDREVLPIIQARADKLVEMENNGGWGQRTAIAHLTYGGGGGHLNAAGVLCAAYLLMAKECGADIPEDTLLRTLAHFYRYAGRGNVSYGNSKPEGGFTDNGKNGKNAFVMAAAANLTQGGDDCIYARARDVAAQFAFYSTGYMLHGHTGGGIGEIWRSASMSLMREKMPVHYRDFMDTRRWHYELSRRFDGSFGILEGARYDDPEWGVGYALTYTVPRGNLRLFGAPPTPHSQRFELPERPWGTAADDHFASMMPARLPDGTLPDLSNETMADSTGFAHISKRGNNRMDRDMLLYYLHHPNYTMRTIYRDQIRHHDGLADELLDHPDARVRRTVLEFLNSNSAGDNPLNTARLDRIQQMLADPAESWFVKDKALTLLAKAPEPWLIDRLDLLLPFLEHPEWWLRQSTLVALTPIVAADDAYQRVIPAIGNLIRTNHIFNITGVMRWGRMPELIRDAPPHVHELAREEFSQSYTLYEPIRHQSDVVNEQVDPTMREFLAETLANVPGGLDVLHEVSTGRDPDAALPYADLYLDADPENLSPSLKEQVNQIVKTRLIPQYIARSRSLLLREQEFERVPRRFRYTEPRVLGLVDLYQRIGIDRYDWRDFGPAPTEKKWHYHSFDPPEELAWDSGRPRYREITLPEGMENWNHPDFDPAAAGWRTGRAPFGATDGELVTREGNCDFDFCRHGKPMRTLWENEVLLLRGKFDFPELKPGHRYQLIIGGMSHVGAGEGHRIYINGELFYERERSVERRAGAQPIGREICRDWRPHFENGEVDIAFLGFMGGRHGRQSRHLMIWIREMEFPPLGTAEILESATVYPMRSSAWQELQDPDANVVDGDHGKFRWNGEFVANPDVTGKWRTVARVAEPGDFDPERRRDAHRAPLSELELNPGGSTHSPLWIWSGDILMDLDRNEALAMHTDLVAGTEYLFIEAGGFHPDHDSDWTTPWFVLERE